jgi:hypothetical protein
MEEWSIEIASVVKGKDEATTWGGYIEPKFPHSLSRASMPLRRYQPVMWLHVPFLTAPPYIFTDATCGALLLKEHSHRKRLRSTGLIASRHV